ncbi:hypothetical protein ACLKA7_001623 [Drosophila subpalustris]
MSKCTTDKSNLSPSGSYRPLSDINLHKRDKNFEERFVVRSLENFPPRQQAATSSITTTTTTTRRKSTTCVCRRCSRSSSPPSRRSDPGQQMFQHLISKRRKPERLLVPDLATEWFRKQKVFLDQVTGKEKRAQQRPHRLDESLISLSIKCDDSRSNSVQYLNYCQEVRRRKLLLRRQRQLQRDGTPVCRCTDPPNWPPSRNSQIEQNNQKLTSPDQDVKQEKKEKHTKFKSPSMVKTERNPIKVCPKQMAGCLTDSPVDKPRTAGGSCCQTKPDPLLYPHRRCSCEQRVRRRNSCSCIYQADGQPMAKECIAALRTESSLPRLRKKYNLRQVPQRRLDPGRFRRISPQFYSLLKTYEDGITEKYPLYGIPMRYFGKTVPCCPCEVSVPPPPSATPQPNSPSTNANEPCLGDQSVVTAVSKPIVMHERFKECDVPVACPVLKSHPKECDGCQGKDCRNHRCELKPKNSVIIGSKNECSSQHECDHECERDKTSLKTIHSDLQSCNNETCRNRRNIPFNATNITVNTNLHEIRPVVKPPEIFLEAPKILADQSKENSAFTRHLEQLRNSFSYQPQPYRPTKRRTLIVDHGGNSNVVEKRVSHPLVKRKGVLGSIAGVCKRAFFPGRYLLNNFSNGFQRHSHSYHKNHHTDPTLYSGKAKKQKRLLEADPNTFTYKYNYNYAQFKTKPDHKHRFNNGVKRSQYTENPNGRDDGLRTKSGERDDQHTEFHNEKNDQYMAKTEDQRVADISGRNDQYTNNSSGRNDQYIAASGGRDVEYKDQLDGRNKRYAPNSAVRNDQTTTHSGGRNDQYIADSGRRIEQYIADFGEKKDQYIADSNRMNEQSTAHSGRRKDQYMTNVGERNDQYNFGGKNDQSTGPSERRNDQSTARSGGRNDQHKTKSGERNDQSNAHFSRRNDQYITITGRRNDQYKFGVTNGQSTGNSAGKRDQYLTKSGGRNDPYTAFANGKNDQSTVHSGRRNDQQLANSDEINYHDRADPNIRVDQYEVGSGVRNVNNTQSLASPGVKKYTPKLQPKSISQQPITDSDSTISQFTADSGKEGAQFDDFGNRGGYYTARSSFIDNLSKSDSDATITQVLVNFGDTESQSTAISEENADNSGKKAEEYKSKPNSGETVSETTYDSGLTTEIAISTVSARPNFKERRIKTPRVSCRRSFTPVSDYQLVMRLMGRKRAKSQSNKRCTVTFVDRKRQKVNAIETNRKQSSIAEHNRNKSRQSVNSTTASRQKSLSRDRSLMPSTGMRRSIHKGSENSTYETQRVHRSKKRTNRVQYADQEEQESTPATRYPEDSVATSRKVSRYRHDGKNTNEELEDRKWIERQREDTEDPRTQSQSLKQEKVTGPTEARAKIAPISPAAIKVVPDPQREIPQQTWQQTSPRFIEVNSKQKKPMMSSHDSHGSSISSQLGHSPQKVSRNSTRPLKISSIRLNRKSQREEELFVEQPATYSKYNPGVFRRQGRSLSRRISSRSMESSRSNDSDSRRQLMLSISTNDDTSLDTIQRQEECLGTVTRYTNQTPNNFSAHSGRISTQLPRKKSSPSLLPTIFTRKPPPLNEKLLRQREAYASMEQAHKPKTYSPQRMKKQLSLLTRRPAVRVMRSFHQEAAIQEQAQRWHRIKRMMKQDEETLSQYQAKQEANEDRELYDRPLQIRDVKQPMHHNNHDEDLDSPKAVSSRSRSGCDLQFQTDRQRRPLSCTLKRKLPKGYVTPCSSACNLKSHDSISYQRKRIGRSNVEEKSSRSSCDQDGAESSSLIDLIRQKQERDSARFSSGSVEQEVEVDEADEEDERETQFDSYQSRRHKFASVGYEFLKQAAFGSQRAMGLATGSNTFQSTIKRKLSSRAPVPALNAMNNHDRLSESISYSQSSRQRSSSPADEQPPRNIESCHRKCHHSGYTNINRPCPAQLSSILKSPSKHFKSSNEGRRVNFVGSQPSIASIARSDYHHSVNNGIYTGTCGCSSVSIKTGTRRPSVVRAHTVHSSTEPPIVPNEAHSFTFLNRDGSALSRAPRMTVREIKPQAPSLFAVPVTPTVDFDFQNSRSGDVTPSDERLPLKNNQEPFVESRLPMSSQLLSKRTDYRPRRTPLNDRCIPPPVSLVSDLDFHTYYATTRSMALGDQREEGGTGSPCSPTVVTSMMDQLRLKQNAKLLRATRAAAIRQPPKQTTSMDKWIYPAATTSGDITQQSQRSPYDCIDRAEQPDYYPRRRCWLRRLPEEPLVIAPTHGALREQQILQRCLPVLFYGRQR